MITGWVEIRVLTLIENLFYYLKPLLLLLLLILVNVIDRFALQL